MNEPAKLPVWAIESEASCNGGVVMLAVDVGVEDPDSILSYVNMGAMVGPSAYMGWSGGSVSEAVAKWFREEISPGSVLQWRSGPFDGVAVWNKVVVEEVVSISAASGYTVVLILRVGGSPSSPGIVAAVDIVEYLDLIRDLSNETEMFGTYLRCVSSENVALSMFTFGEDCVLAGIFRGDYYQRIFDMLDPDCVASAMKAEGVSKIFVSKSYS